MIRESSLAAVITAAVLATVSPLPDSASRPEARCSIMPFAPWKDERETWFVGTALADTAVAGLGSVRTSRYGGHWGPGRERTVYGQLVDVDTIGGAQASLVSNTLERARNKNVVIVPWDYDPSCMSVHWSETARWIEPGLVGFYKVRLRPRSHWAGGRPTFDAFAAIFEPYPHGPFFERGYYGTDSVRTQPSLDAREMFSLHDVLPTVDEGRRNDAAAMVRVQEWIAANPEVARKYPVPAILAMLARARSHR